MASAGRVLPLPKGAYSSSTTYHLLDFVSYQGSTYICKQTSTGNAPTNTTYWQIMAQGTESASVAGNYYGTCSTGASTSAKIVSIPATENFVLQVGDIIGIKFDYTNTANNPSLNVNNSGAKPIYYNNSAVSTSNLWASGEANRVTIFMYDGTNWIWMGHDVDIDTDTLSDLKDTTISSASNGQVLMYDSTSGKWKNQTPTTTLVGLSDTQISSATDGQVLKYNSTSQKWVNGEDKGGILPHLIVISETGSTVTVVKGGTTISATETSTEHFECDVPEFGTWTIHSVLNGEDVTVNLVVDTVKVYTVDDSHFHSDITVTYPSGATCSLTDGTTTLYANTNPYTFTVHHAGNYTITVTYNGQTYTDTVTVTTTGQTFTKKVPSPSSAPANDIDWWLWFGGVSGSYSSLSDILADSTALATLMASSDAVDYLVTAKAFIDGICASATAMAYIGLNNYCANTLLADSDWLDGIADSTYMESVLNVKVPVMTSNTTPSGTCSAKVEGTPAYRAFNGDLSDYWYNYVSGSGGTLPTWIQYDFGNNVNIYKTVFYPLYQNSALRVKDYEILSSTDGTNFTSLATGQLANSQALSTNGVSEITKSTASKFRINITSNYASSGGASGINEIQFYGRADV